MTTNEITRPTASEFIAAFDGIPASALRSDDGSELDTEAAASALADGLLDALPYELNDDSAGTAAKWASRAILTDGPWWVAR
jgi:hypothetical protein